MLQPLLLLLPFVGGSGLLRRRMGFLAGEIRVPDDFDRMGEREIERLFGGAE